MRKTFTHARLFATALAGALLLSGCGIKGPLYLPQPQQAKPAGPDHSNKAESPAAARP